MFNHLDFGKYQQAMKLILAIGIGSFIGGVSRYLLSRLIQAKFLSTFPYGILSVNSIGCFLIGVVFGFAERGSLTQEWRLFLATGVLGGFTTFSAFSIETVAMLREGQYGGALVYVTSSVIIGVIATFTGIFLVKLM